MSELCYISAPLLAEGLRAAAAMVGKVAISTSLPPSWDEDTVLLVMLQINKSWSQRTLLLSC